MQKIIIFVLTSLILITQPVNAKDEFFLMLKNKKVNVRYGPGFDYQVKYIYKKIQLPLKVIDKKENFRKILDHKNNSGWIHISQLKSSKSLVIMENKILFKRDSIYSKPLVKIEKGRLVHIKKCTQNWCKVKTNNYTGWLNIKNVWGIK